MSKLKKYILVGKSLHDCAILHCSFNDHFIIDDLSPSLSLSLSLSPPGSTAGCPLWCRCSSWCHWGRAPICRSGCWCACWASHRTWPPGALPANLQTHPMAPAKERVGGRWIDRRERKRERDKEREEERHEQVKVFVFLVTVCVGMCYSVNTSHCQDIATHTRSIPAHIFHSVHPLAETDRRP